MAPRLASVLLAVLLSAGAHATGIDDRLVPPQKAVTPAFFGIHNIRFHNPALRPRIPIAGWRLWDSGTSWAELEPRRGEWNFERLEFALDVARGNGQEVLLTFGRTPGWASARPTERSFYGPGEAAPPRDMRDFAQYVRSVSTRYRGRINLYEVWNEPASGGMFTGSVEQMVQLTQIAREELSRADPTARLVCPSPAKHESLGWFRRFLAAGGANHCDIIGYHFYVDTRQPEDKLKLIAEVKELLARHGQASKPLWDTESGLGIGSQGVRPTSVASDEAQIIRGLILAWAGGLERFYWYAWDHDHQGFVHPNGDLRDRALGAYRQAQLWMIGSLVSECQRSGVQWTCHMLLGDGKKARILWTHDNSTKPLAVRSHARVQDMLGQSYKPDAKGIHISGNPVLVID